MSVLKGLVRGSVLMPQDCHPRSLLHPHKRGLQNLGRMARYGNDDAVDMLTRNTVHLAHLLKQNHYPGERQ